MGKSDTILDVIGQRLDQAPAPILYVGPNKQFITEQWEPRISGLLDEAPTLRAKVARGKRMTKTRKVISGVPLRLAHGGSSTALKSDPAALAITDEADEMMSNVKGQGSPIGLVDARGDTYADFVHAITSTPSEGLGETEVDPESGLEFWKTEDPEDISSTIWRLWQAGTRYHWAWPCPHCGEFFIPRFKCLVIPQGSPAEAKAGTYLGCPRCGVLIDDAAKSGMNERGVYVAPGQKIAKDGTVSGEIPESETVSFWVSGLCSPFKSFGERAARYVEAMRSGDDHEVQAAINAGFGELWTKSSGDLPEWSALASLKRPYGEGDVPDAVLFLTCGVDVQRNRLVYAIRGWGSRATSWLIDAGELWGETSEDPVWEALTHVILAEYGGLNIRTVLVDAGFRPNKRDAGDEHRVYAFCRQFPRLVFPSKGYATLPSDIPVLKSKIEVTPRGKVGKYGLELVRVNTDHCKSWVQARLRWPEDQPGAFYLHDTTSEDYCQQLVSEYRTRAPNGRAVWVTRTKNNHYLDCEALNMAAGYLLNVAKIPEGVVRDWGPPPTETIVEADPEDDAPPPAPVMPPPPRAGGIRDRFSRNAGRVNR